MRVPGQEPLSASMLAAAPLHEQKQMIGEWLVLLPRSRRGARHQLTHQLEVSWGDQVPSLKLTRLLGDLVQSTFTSQAPVHLKTLVRPGSPRFLPALLFSDFDSGWEKPQMWGDGWGELEGVGGGAGG